ncbi:MAG: DUF4390 domain-containing protein [Desulfobacteraceae bacterium]
MKPLLKAGTAAPVILMVICAVLLCGRNACARQNAELNDIKLTNDRDHLITYFTVNGAFTEKIRNAVQKGVPTKFSFYVSLYRIKEGWFDKKLSDIQLTSALKYDTLKKRFTVTRSWKEDDPFVTTSFDEAKKMMTEVNNLKVKPLESLDKGEKYQIRIKAELNRVTMPLYLHYVFFFVSFWDFETDWYIINFTY